MVLFAFLDRLLDIDEFVFDIFLKGMVLHKNSIHFLTVLSFGGSFDGLGVVGFDILNFLVVGIESTDHNSNRFDFFSKFLSELYFFLVVLIVLSFIPVVGIKFLFRFLAGNACKLNTKRGTILN